MGRRGEETRPGKVGELRWHWRVRFARDGRWAARGQGPTMTTGPEKLESTLAVHVSGCAADDEFRTMLEAERAWARILGGQKDAAAEFDRIGAELG